MKVLLVASLCLAFAVSGCVWTADSVPVLPPPPALPYQVHVISKRLLDGTEQTATIIAPLNPEYAYNYSYSASYYDSVRYIIVNGDTAYRHPVAIFPAVYDSLTPFHFDGNPNFVTFVFSRTTATDTSHMPFTPGAITWPAAGTTIVRDSGLTVNYREPSDNTVYTSGQIEVTDSITSIITSADATIGDSYIAASRMALYKGNLLWIMLHETAESSSDRDYYPYEYHSILFDRMVAYSLK